MVVCDCYDNLGNAFLNNAFNDGKRVQDWDFVVINVIKGQVIMKIMKFWHFP